MNNLVVTTARTRIWERIPKLAEVAGHTDSGGLFVGHFPDPVEFSKNKDWSESRPCNPRRRK